MPVIPIVPNVSNSDTNLVAQSASFKQYLAAYVDSIADFIEIITQQLRQAEENKIDVVLNLHFNRSDRVKAVIDTAYAHQTQKLIIEKIMLCLRETDKLIFVSQQECWIFLPQLSSDALAILAVHRLLSVLNLPIQIDKTSVLNNPNNLFLHPSIGVACSPVYHFDAHALIDIADKAQKNAAINHLQFSVGQAHSDLHLASEEKLKFLQKELDENSLEIKYQPKVDIQLTDTISVEALVRWPTAHHHPIETHHLIALSEEFGLIEQLTMQVVNKVFQDVHQWEKQGIKIVVWINLSAQLLSSEHLPQLLTRALQIWNISSSSIGFEITESALIQNIEHTTELLFELKNAGFQLAIDDFGTGYSSFAYLRRFPICEIKIDKIFVQGMVTSIQDRQIVQSIINLGHNFGLKVVAEGIEDDTTLDLLKTMKCDCIQGYLIAHPMQHEQIVAWYQKMQSANQINKA